MRDTGASGHLWTADGYFMEDLFPVREGTGPVYADSHLVVSRTVDPLGLRFAGEIDISNSDAVAESLHLILDDSPRPHLDLSGLSFSDISGIRAMVELAQALGSGRQILLHGLPRQLQTVMRVTGWAELPSLALCECVGVTT